MREVRKGTDLTETSRFYKMNLEQDPLTRRRFPKTRREDDGTEDPRST
jgi:hypothetical protein